MANEPLLQNVEAISGSVLVSISFSPPLMLDARSKQGHECHHSIAILISLFLDHTLKLTCKVRAVQQIC